MNRRWKTEVCVPDFPIHLSDGKSDVFIEAIGVYVALVNVCIA